MVNKTTEGKLTAKKLHELGNELNDLIYQIKMNNLTIEGLEFAQHKDQGTFLLLVNQYFTTAHSLNENISEKLDNISYLLINSDNENKEVR